MGLVLEARVLARGQQWGSLGDRPADRLDPAYLRFGEIAQYIMVDERLVAGMADADPHPLVVGAEVGGDRAQSVVAGVAAADLDPDLARGEIKLVVDNDERAEVELRIAQRCADAAP